MRFTPLDPPREFVVGKRGQITMRDCGRVELSADEQVTFHTEAGGEYDVVRKPWGFYATPSLNGRLPRFGLRPVLVANASDQYYVLLVEAGQEPAFQEYALEEALRVVAWLDTQEQLAAIERSAGATK